MTDEDRATFRGVFMDTNTWAGATHWGKIVGNFFGVGFLVPLLILIFKGKEDLFWHDVCDAGTH